MTRRLYPYQREAREAIYDAWERRGLRSVAVVIPTGGGKTTVFSSIAHDFHRTTGRRVLVIAHRKELIEQAAARQREESPDLTVGIVKAASNQTLADIVVGSVATLRNPRRLRQMLNVGLIIIDECHHSSADSYLKIIAAFPEARVLGVTATFTRGDRRGLNKVFDDVVYQVPISLLQQQGYLVHARGRRVGVPSLDLSRVRTTAGDYRDGDLDAALSASLAPQAIVRAVQEHAPHDSTVVFTPGVHFATLMHEAFDAAGFTSAWVSGATPDHERTRILKAAHAGDIQVVSNCAVLTEGWDSPRFKTAVLARPTKSEGLFIQMAGRVLRPYPGYTHALILDVVGATAMHSLNARIDLFGEEAAEEIEREPCRCDSGDEGDVLCPCGRRRCTADCACGGGLQDECSCVRPEKVEPREPQDQLLEDDRVDGELFSVEVDLFHASRNQWLITHGGTWFLSAGQRFIALVPGRRRATWSAVSVSRREGGGSTYILRDVPDKGYAMQFAEDVITLAERRTARKDRSWRAKPLTAMQLQDAAAWGVVVPPDAHGGMVADLIAIEQASRRMDAVVARMLEQQQ